MNFVSNISSGIIASFKFKKLAIYTFSIQLFLSILIGSLGYSYIQENIGQSLQLASLMKGYNHDVIQDLTRVHHSGWLLLKQAISILVLTYLLMGPFISGGVFYGYASQSESLKTFIKGGVSHYKSILGLNALIIGIILLLTAIIGGASIYAFTNGLEYFTTEVPPLIIIGVLLLILLTALMILFTISTIGKWQIVYNEHTTIQAFKFASSYVSNHFGYFLSLGIVYLLLSIALAFILNAAINIIPENTFIFVFLAFLIQLFSLFIRVIIRHGYWFSIIKKNGH